MRKTLKICGFVTFALLLQSCVGFVTPPPEVEVLEDGQIAFILPDFNIAGETPDTKTYYNGSKLVWSETDTVGIVPPTGSLIYFSLKGRDQSDDITFDGGGWQLKPSTLYTSFYPFIDDMHLDMTAVRYCVEGQHQDTMNVRRHDGYDCLYSKATTTDGSAVSFSFTRLCICLDFQVTPPKGTYTRMDICADEDIIPLEATFDLTQDTPALGATRLGKTLSLALNSFELGGSQQIHVYLTAIPCDWRSKPLTIKFVTSEGREYAYSKTPSQAYNVPNTLYTLELDSCTEVADAVFKGLTQYGLYNLSGTTPSAIFQYAEGDQISRFIRPELCEFRIGNPSSGKFMAFVMTPGSADTLKDIEIYAPYKHDGAAVDYTSYNGDVFTDVEVIKQEGDIFHLKETSSKLGFIVKYTEI